MASRPFYTLVAYSCRNPLRHLWKVVAWLFLINVSNAFAIDCTPLEPEPTSEELTQFEGEITGEIDGLFSKFVGAEGTAEGAYLYTYRSLIDKIPKDDRFRKIAWEKTLYIYCQIIAESDLTDKEKLHQIGELFQKSGTVPPDVSGEIKRIPKLVASKSFQLLQQEEEIVDVQPGDRIEVSGNFMCGFWLGYKLDERIPGAPKSHTAISVEADYVTDREDYISREFIVPEFPTDEKIRLFGKMTNGGTFNDWPCYGTIQIFSASN